MVLVCMLWVSCASNPQPPIKAWAPSESEIRTAFKKIRPPYKDPFAKFAFTDGFISAYALGSGSVGVFISNPRSYTRERQISEAYYRGFSEGAQLAFKTGMKRPSNHCKKAASKPGTE